jgi:hypothetical protein
VLDQALGDQRLQRVEIRIAEGLGRLERPATREYAEPREELPLLGEQKLVAPVDRCTQRLLPSRNVTCAGGEEVETTPETLENLPRGQ